MSDEGMNLPKCLLLPIDGTNESLRPVQFISRLYRPSEVNLILCYFCSAASPAYSGAVVQSSELVRKKGNSSQRINRMRAASSIMPETGPLKEGFSEELIQEHVQQREMSVAKQACLLADIRKVDAVLVQKRVTSGLKGFIRGDSASALLEHCLASPVWFTEGEIDPRAPQYVFSMRRRGCGLPTMRVSGLLHRRCNYASARGEGSLLPLRAVPRRRRNNWPTYADRPLGRDKLSYLLKASARRMDYGLEERRIRIMLTRTREILPGNPCLVRGLTGWE